MKKLIGPFKQVLPLNGLPFNGVLHDSQLNIIADGGILVEGGLIKSVGVFDNLIKTHTNSSVEEVEGKYVLIPGFIDCHTHICFAGNRAKDYALRNAGKTYLEIAESGGGIWDTVTQTRLASIHDLVKNLLQKIEYHLNNGITSIEIKSGYGLNLPDELKQLRAIKEAASLTKADIISTCLAAHTPPIDFKGTHKEYLRFILNELLPIVKSQDLSNRVDIFIEKSAFNITDGFHYLSESKKMGFDTVVHGDQFTSGGSEIATKLNSVSVDHLEVSTDTEIKLIVNSDIVAVVLPGASLGLGMQYAPVRKLLDVGACVAIASDWNPGSAPMGDLLTQAAILGASEKMTTAEVFAGLTFRAAKALKLVDRGIIQTGMLADMQAYQCDDYREILYYQGRLKPSFVWKKGELIKNNK